MGRKTKFLKLEDLMHDSNGGVVEKTWQDQRDEAVQQQVESRKVQVRGKTTNHNLYLKSIDTNVVTICVGPAGTGKTWMACGKAVEMLLSGNIGRIIITRPLVQCDEDTGFLPGDLTEKVGPFVQPMLDAFGDFLDRKFIEKLMKEGMLQIVPLGLMRGKSMPGSFIILDEAQNATYKQLHMFLTRFGHGSKVVVNGDYTQSDLSEQGGVPLSRAITNFRRRSDFSYRPLQVVEFNRGDIVRHPFIQWIDESLSGDYEEVAEQGGQDEVEWLSIKCPECGETLWYDSMVEEEDALVKCWRCRSDIELFDDHDDSFAPEVVDGDSVDIIYESFPVKP